MKRIISLAAVVVALLALSGCDKKTSYHLKQKTEEAKKTVETKTKEAKDAADKKLEKEKEAAKEAETKLNEMADKDKKATQEEYGIKEVAAITAVVKEEEA